ncbi:hypothetical protein ACIBF5_09640 [Micromonospora sp. NPDC050417]|uniref:hypothetical protein n=1 Tax=Micromonospora sp. NPDC050417 TaxID=3364280 RepID=UPI0037B76E83
MTTGPDADRPPVPCRDCKTPLKSAQGQARGRGEQCWREYRRRLRAAQAATAAPAGPVRTSTAGLDGPDLFTTEEITDVE